MNFGLPLGIICGLIGGLISGIQYYGPFRDFGGMVNFGTFSDSGWLVYGLLLNKVKGSG